MEPKIIKGIEILPTPVPEEYIFIKVYDKKHGIQTQGYAVKSKKYTRARNEKIAKSNADRDTKLAETRKKAQDLGLERTVDLVLKENKELDLGITAVTEPAVYKTITGLRQLKDACGFQGFLTTYFNVAAYKKK
ncbi:hypothetical protein KY342_06390 [Candidatus Woesearchaeota archaeon]|nr:hypothetical protein [Candidatus Woesearchaeota archaeon]